ncbi:hypothetical protein FRC03_003877 [Tulasnella sp. 419]|nr:hypothetical protein FRC03_003877 [Tulasnella sp. 419]
MCFSGCSARSHGPSSELAGIYAGFPLDFTKNHRKLEWAPLYRLLQQPANPQQSSPQQQSMPSSEWKVWLYNVLCWTKNIVLGESFTAPEPGDPSIVHMLDSVSLTNNRAMSPQKQRSMPLLTNVGQLAVSLTTPAESERASSLLSWSVIKHPNGAVTTLGGGGAAMVTSGGSPSLGLSTREGGRGPPQQL